MRCSHLRFELLVCGALLVGAPGCPADISAAVPIALDVHVTGRGRSAVDVNGRTVSFSAAQLCIAGLETYEGDAVLAQAFGVQRSDWTSTVRDLLSFRSAHAHPGHYEAGGTMGDVVGPAVVDLAATTPVVLRGEGISGHHGSATLTLCDDDSIGGALRLAGTVTLDDGTTRAFSFSTAAGAAIEGIAINVEASGDLSLLLEVDLAAFVARADFSAAAVSAFNADDVVVPASGSQLDNAFVRAAASSSTYVFSSL